MNERALSTIDPRAVGDRFRAVRRLTVRQRKKWIEILLSFESKNAYDVYDDTGRAAFSIREIGTGIGEFVRRMFLGPMRPFHVEVVDAETGDVVLSLMRPFRFVFHRLEVRAGSGELIGAIERRWAWVRRVYVVENAQGVEVATLFGPMLKPWTFEIHESGRRVGMVQKRWSGIGKEMFTDADNFGVELDEIASPELKALAFAATVLIDVVHFERAK